jgi:hypothetical protein
MESGERYSMTWRGHKLNISIYNIQKILYNLTPNFKNSELGSVACGHTQEHCFMSVSEIIKFGP